MTSPVAIAPAPQPQSIFARQPSLAAALLKDIETEERHWHEIRDRFTGKLGGFRSVYERAAPDENSGQLLRSDLFNPVRAYSRSLAVFWDRTSNRILTVKAEDKLNAESFNPMASMIKARPQAGQHRFNVLDRLTQAALLVEGLRALQLQSMGNHELTPKLRVEAIDASFQNAKQILEWAQENEGLKKIREHLIGIGKGDRGEAQLIREAFPSFFQSSNGVAQPAQVPTTPATNVQPAFPPLNTPASAPAPTFRPRTNFNPYPALLPPGIKPQQALHYLEDRLSQWPGAINDLSKKHESLKTGDAKPGEEPVPEPLPEVISQRLAASIEAAAVTKLSREVQKGALAAAYYLADMYRVDLAPDPTDGRLYDLKPRVPEGFILSQDLYPRFAGLLQLHNDLAASHFQSVSTLQQIQTAQRSVESYARNHVSAEQGEDGAGALRKLFRSAGQNAQKPIDSEPLPDMANALPMREAISEWRKTAKAFIEFEKTQHQALIASESDLTERAIEGRLSVTMESAKEYQALLAARKNLVLSTLARANSLVSAANAQLELDVYNDVKQLPQSPTLSDSSVWGKHEQERYAVVAGLYNVIELAIQDGTRLDCVDRISHAVDDCEKGEVPVLEAIKKRPAIRAQKKRQMVKEDEIEPVALTEAISGWRSAVQEFEKYEEDVTRQFGDSFNSRTMIHGAPQLRNLEKATELLDISAEAHLERLVAPAGGNLNRVAYDRFRQITAQPQLPSGATLDADVLAEYEKVAGLATTINYAARRRFRSDKISGVKTALDEFAEGKTPQIPDIDLIQPAKTTAGQQAAAAPVKSPAVPAERPADTKPAAPSAARADLDEEPEAVHQPGGTPKPNDLPELEVVDEIKDAPGKLTLPEAIDHWKKALEAFSQFEANQRERLAGLEITEEVAKIRLSVALATGSVRQNFNAANETLLEAITSKAEELAATVGGECKFVEADGKRLLELRPAIPAQDALLEEAEEFMTYEQTAALFNHIVSSVGSRLLKDRIDGTRAALEAFEKGEISWQRQPEGRSRGADPVEVPDSKEVTFEKAISQWVTAADAFDRNVEQTKTRLNGLDISETVRKTRLYSAQTSSTFRQQLNSATATLLEFVTDEADRLSQECGGKREYVEQYGCRLLALQPMSENEEQVPDPEKLVAYEKIAALYNHITIAHTVRRVEERIGGTRQALVAYQNGEICWEWMSQKTDDAAQSQTDSRESDGEAALGVNGNLVFSKPATDGVWPTLPDVEVPERKKVQLSVTESESSTPSALLQACARMERATAAFIKFEVEERSQYGDSPTAAEKRSLAKRISQSDEWNRFNEEAGKFFVVLLDEIQNVSKELKFVPKEYNFGLVEGISLLETVPPQSVAEGGSIEKIYAYTRLARLHNEFITSTLRKEPRAQVAGAMNVLEFYKRENAASTMLEAEPFRAPTVIHPETVRQVGQLVHDTVESVEGGLRRQERILEKVRLKGGEVESVVTDLAQARDTFASLAQNVFELAGGRGKVEGKATAMAGRLADSKSALLVVALSDSADAIEETLPTQTWRESAGENRVQISHVLKRLQEATKAFDPEFRIMRLGALERSRTNSGRGSVVVRGEPGLISSVVSAVQGVAPEILAEAFAK